MVNFNPNLRSLVFPAGGFSGTMTWYGMRLHQSRAEHDVAEIIGTHVGATAPVQSGTPVAALWGPVPDSYRTWYGYVHTADRALTDTLNEIRFTCVGPSYALAGGGQTVWPGSTASAVVESLTRARGLAVDDTPTTRAYEHVSQAGQTEWELVNRLARENSRFVTMDGATVRFLSKQAILAGFLLDTAPTFAYMTNTLNNIIHFQGMQSEDPGSSTARAGIKSFSGVDPRTGAVITQYGIPGGAPFGSYSGSPMFTDVQSQYSVTSLEEAAALSDAALELSSWKYQMTATVKGDTRLKPGIVIVMQNVGRFTGAWVVNDVTHVLDEHGYSCELTLVSDALGQPPRQFQNIGKAQAPRPAADLVLRTTKGNDPASAAFGGSKLRWQSRNARPVAAPAPAGRVGKPRVR